MTNSKTASRLSVLGIGAAWLASIALGFTGLAYADDTHKFAIANDLSGPSAYHGKTYSSGFNIYLREVNEAGGVGGKKIELIQ